MDENKRIFSRLLRDLVEDVYVIKPACRAVDGPLAPADLETSLLFDLQIIR